MFELEEDLQYGSSKLYLGEISKEMASKNTNNNMNMQRVPYQIDAAPVCSEPSAFWGSA